MILNDKFISMDAHRITNLLFIQVQIFVCLVQNKNRGI